MDILSIIVGFVGIILIVNPFKSSGEGYQFTGLSVVLLLGIPLLQSVIQVTQQKMFDIHAAVINFYYCLTCAFFYSIASVYF
jgi:drug/metabolite transporter (DMT)-like permease